MRDQTEELEENDERQESTTPRRGRPTLYGEALTPAQRAARYRKRKQQRMGAAIENLAEASDTRLLELLYHHLVRDGETDSPDGIVPQVLSELLKRYPDD
jgi:hypothetical protein